MCVYLCVQLGPCPIFPLERCACKESLDVTGSCIHYLRLDICHRYEFNNQCNDDEPRHINIRFQRRFNSKSSLYIGFHSQRL